VGANNSTAGVYAACAKLREMIAQKLGFNSEAEFTDGEVRAGNRRVPLAEAARDGSLSAEDAIEYGDLHKKYQSTFGAHFVEVGVDIATAEIRVRRMLSVCAADRILNPKSARSQVIGAMTMGVGAALMEELVVDKRIGFFVNHDLAGYEVPVHADIPHQDMIFLDETDPMSSPMKAKGVAELGICGGRRRQRDLQCQRRTRARLSHHAGQADRQTTGGRMRPRSARSTQISIRAT
jgi:xanthine dehydrogenase YagR molybdenum-binding subunit